MIDEAEIVANADLLIEEGRRQIDAQLTTASEIDGRAGTLLGLIGGLAGIAGIFGDINLATPSEQPLRWIATVGAAALAAASTLFLTWSLWPRSGASYGPDLAMATAIGDVTTSLQFKRSIVRSLRDAKAANAAWLAVRQSHLRYGIVLFALAIGSIAFMIAAGVFIPVPAPANGA